METHAIEAVEPIYEPVDSDRAVLLLHGFTSTPLIFRELVPLLKAQGFTVYAPLLTGHGTSPDDLERTTWRDWYATAAHAYRFLRTNYNHISIVGVSFGGALAFSLASHYSITSVVAVATPRWIRRHQAARLLTPIASRLGVRHYKKKHHTYEPNEPIPVIGGPTYSYPIIPLQSVRHFFHFIEREIPARLSKVSAPTLIIQSTTDNLVHPKSGNYYYKRLGSEVKRILWVTGRHDELHLGVVGELVCQHIMHFLAEQST